MVGVQTGEHELRTNGDGVAVPAAPRRLPAATSTKVFGFLVSCGLLVVATFASIAYGTKSIPFGTVWDALWHYDASNNEHLIVRTLRIPRTVVGLGVGGALGLAGAVMQGVTRNPLADPAILGIEAGAALGVVIGIYSFGVGTLTGYVWFGFVGAAVASVVVYTLGSIGRGGATPVKLALAGGALAALLQSLTSAILLLDVETLDQYRFWAVGSLAGRDADVAVDVLPFLVVGMVLALVSAKALNTLALGDDMATSLGLPVQSARAICALAVVILCGAATAAAGPIAFVGLTVPHVARAIVGPDYRWILPWSLVLGPTLLLGADVIARLVARPGELQVGIVTALLGAPFFIALVRRRKLAEL
jgi:iron complex transport system permease protein